MYSTGYLKSSLTQNFWYEQHRFEAVSMYEHTEDQNSKGPDVSALLFSEITVGMPPNFPCVLNR